MHWMLRLSLICLLVASATSASAAGFSRVGTFGFTWDGIYPGGRLASMGGSNLADGSPATLLVNPAPLSTGNSAGMSYDFMDYFSDFQFHTYSGAAEWNNLRLNFALQDFVAKDLLIRTAYNPEGTGETADSRQRMTVLGLSYDLGRAVFENGSISWALGAAWRNYSSEFAESSFSADAFDIGTTLNWRTEYAGGWIGLTGVVALENVSDKSFYFDDRVTWLPHTTRFGINFEAARPHPDRSGNLFKILLAFNHASVSSKSYGSDVNSVGLEILLLDALAVRAGHNNRFSGGSNTFGIGGVLDGRLLGPFTVEVDLGMVGINADLLNESQMVFGIRSKYHF